MKSDAFIIERRPKTKRAAKSFVVIVGLKVSKKATDRNLLKRRIKGVIHRNKITVKPGEVVFIRALPLALRLNKKELENFLISLLKRSNVY